MEKQTKHLILKVHLVNQIIFSSAFRLTYALSFVAKVLDVKRCQKEAPTRVEFYLFVRVCESVVILADIIVASANVN